MASDGLWLRLLLIRTWKWRGLEGSSTWTSLPPDKGRGNACTPWQRVGGQGGSRSQLSFPVLLPPAFVSPSVVTSPSPSFSCHIALSFLQFTLLLFSFLHLHFVILFFFYSLFPFPFPFSPFSINRVSNVL